MCDNKTYKITKPKYKTENFKKASTSNMKQGNINISTLNKSDY